MFGLSFLFPAFLIGSAAIAVPIVLHLMRRETAPRIQFSAVRFLKRVPVEQTRRKRLRELLLLALRIAALLLLAIAFARPYLGAYNAAGAVVTVVAVDTSFSMSAPGQFERAQDLALDVVDLAPSGHLVSVVSFDDVATTVLEPSTNRGAARAAIGRLTPRFGATHYRRGLAQAAEAIGPLEGRIVVVTDLQRSGWERDDQGAVPERLTVEVLDAESPVRNLAVTAIQREPTGTVAVVQNVGAGFATAHVTLYIDGRTVAETEVTAGPGSTDVRFPVPLPSLGVASVSIEDRDGYPADNTRYLILDPPEPAPLLAITARGDPSTDAFYLERALMAAEEASRFDLIGALPAELPSLAGERLAELSAILLLATQDLNRSGKEALASYVSGGGGLLVVAGANLDSEVVTNILGEDSGLVVRPAEGVGANISFAPADARHPIFRPFGALTGNLGQVRFRRVVLVEEGEGVQVIARFSDGTAGLVEYRSGDGRALLFASDLNNEWNDFPRHPTFVPFVHEMMRYLVRDRERPQGFVVAEAPAGTPREPGFATIGQSGRRVAVNVDVSESDPTRVSPEEFRAAIGRLTDVAAAEARSDAVEYEDQQTYWRFLLVLMALVLAGEGVLGSRMA